MKTPEDEAFDDLARNQGAWGGGFPAKRAMAANKLHWNEDEWRRNNWRCGHGWLRGEQCESCNAAKEPPSEWAGIKAILDEYGLQAIDFVADFKAALAEQAQEQDWKTMPPKDAPLVQWAKEQTAQPLPVQEPVNRYCRAGMCVESDKLHEAGCTAHCSPPLPVQEPVALAQEVIGCFHAAELEGLTAALANTSDLHLKDLVERRLMYALYAAQEGDGSK